MSICVRFAQRTSDANTIRSIDVHEQKTKRDKCLWVFRYGANDLIPHRSHVDKFTHTFSRYQRTFHHSEFRSFCCTVAITSSVSYSPLARFCTTTKDANVSLLHSGSSFVHWRVVYHFIFGVQSLNFKQINTISRNDIKWTKVRMTSL